MPDPRWRTSSFSKNEGDCVEMAAFGDGTVGVRDSKDRAGGTLRFTRSEMAAWLNACKAGEFDDLLD